MFRRVQQSMGGRVRFIITGSAPISSKVMDFVRVAFGCQVWQCCSDVEGRNGGGSAGCVGSLSQENRVVGRPQDVSTPTSRTRDAGGLYTTSTIPLHVATTKEAVAEDILCKKPTPAGLSLRDAPAMHQDAILHTSSFARFCYCSPTEASTSQLRDTFT